MEAEPGTRIGDVIVRHNENAAPSLWLVCAVTHEGELTGSVVHQASDKEAALEHARELVTPGCSIFIREEDAHPKSNSWTRVPPN